MTSTIIFEGNIAAPPEMRTSPRGNVYAYVTVIVNYRKPDEDGVWHDVGKTSYAVTVFGAQAQGLAYAAQSGNIRVRVEGDLTDRAYTNKQGHDAVSHDVVAQYVTVSLSGQQVSVTKSAGAAVPDDDIVEDPE